MRMSRRTMTAIRTRWRQRAAIRAAIATLAASLAPVRAVPLSMFASCYRTAPLTDAVVMGLLWGAVHAERNEDTRDDQPVVHFQVAARVRPFLPQEEKSLCVVQMDEYETTVQVRREA